MHIVAIDCILTTTSTDECYLCAQNASAMQETADKEYSTALLEVLTSRRAAVHTQLPEQPAQPAGKHAVCTIHGSLD